QSWSPEPWRKSNPTHPSTDSLFQAVLAGPYGRVEAAGHGRRNIGHADPPRRGLQEVVSQLGDRGYDLRGYAAGQPAYVGSDQAPGAGDAGQDAVFVQGLQDPGVNDLDRDALGGQPLGDAQRAGHHHRYGRDRDVGTRANHLRSHAGETAVRRHLSNVGMKFEGVYVDDRVVAQRGGPHQLVGGSGRAWGDDNEAGRVAQHGLRGLGMLGGGARTEPDVKVERDRHGHLAAGHVAHQRRLVHDRLPRVVHEAARREADDR